MLKTTSAVIVPVATAILGGGVGAVLTYWAADREMDVKMVEIAVGILSQEPKENIAPAREWAVDVIGYYAEVKLSEQVRQALIENWALKSYTAFDFGSMFLSPDTKSVGLEGNTDSTDAPPPN